MLMNIWNMRQTHLVMQRLMSLIPLMMESILDRFLEDKDQDTNQLRLMVREREGGRGREREGEGGRGREREREEERGRERSQNCALIFIDGEGSLRCRPPLNRGLSKTDLKRQLSKQASIINEEKISKAANERTRLIGEEKVETGSVRLN